VAVPLEVPFQAKLIGLDTARKLLAERKDPGFGRLVRRCTWTDKFSVSAISHSQRLDE